MLRKYLSRVINLQVKKVWDVLQQKWYREEVSVHTAKSLNPNLILRTLTFPQCDLSLPSHLTFPKVQSSSSLHRGSNDLVYHCYFKVQSSYPHSIKAATIKFIIFTSKYNNHPHSIVIPTRQQLFFSVDPRMSSLRVHHQDFEFKVCPIVRLPPGSFLSV